MLIFLTGNDALLAQQAIGQIKEKYLVKNDGTELIEIDESTSEPNWTDLQAVPLFATSRLVIIRRLGLFGAATLQSLGRIFNDIPDSTIVVAWDGKTITQKELLTTLGRASKIITVVTPTGRSRLSWLQKRAKELDAQISAEELQALSTEAVSDLWTLETELLSRQGGARTSGSSQNKTSEPFAFFNLIRKRDWKGLKKELTLKAKLGEPIELTLGSLAAAIRKEVRNPDEARPLVTLLADVDVGLKTGLIDPESAAALISAHLPVPALNRVQWEALWEEMAS